MNATSLIKTMEVSGHTIDALLPFCPRKRSAIYLHLKDDPMPLWLWETLEKWHAQNGPLSPPPIEKTFAWMMAKAWRKIVPACRYELKAGRPRNDDDDDPKGGGKPKWTGTKNPDKPAPETDAQPTPDTKTRSVALLQNASDGETTSSGSNLQTATTTSESPAEKQKVKSSEEFLKSPTSSQAKPSNESIATEKFLAKSSIHSMKLMPTALSTNGIQNLEDSASQTKKDDIGAKTEGEFGPTVGPNPHELWQSGLLNEEAYAGRILRQIAAMSPVPRNIMAAFKADIARQNWALEWKESCRQEKAYRYLAQRFGVSMRKREKDPAVQERNERWMTVIAPVVADIRKNSTQSKGAYGRVSFGFKREIIAAALERPEIARQLADGYGVVPTVAQIEKLFRDCDWYVDAKNEPDDFVERTIGWRPKFAGDVILADWTGLPLKVNGQVFEVLNKRTGGKERKHKKFGMHVAVDAASNYTWVDQTYGDNEYATWPRFLRYLLFDCLGYRPRVLVMDKVSGVVTSLLTGSPDDEKPRVMAEVLMWVAAGVKFHVHLPEHANAKGHVEVAAKLLKHRELHALTVRKVLEKHMRGEWARVREGLSHSEVLRMIPQMQESANQRMLSRDGYKLGDRQTIWQTQQDVTLRDQVALDPDAAGYALEIVSKAKQVWVNGSTASIRVGGKRHYAEIHGFEENGLSKRIDNATAWIVPPLPGVGVDPQQYRVCLIEAGRGLPKFHALTATISQKDRFAFDEIRPYLGEGYHALPATNAEKNKKTIDLAADAWKTQVNARREATTGSQVVDRYE